MTKETVRFPDALVDSIKGAVEESDLFESRSEFHRVSSELLLDLLDGDHEPTNFSYRELRAEIEEEVGFELDGTAADRPDPGERDAPEFLEAYVTVRRQALHGDLEGAQEFVAERYDPVSPEALLLDEVIGLHRSERPDESGDDADAGTTPEGVGIADGGPTREAGDVGDGRVGRDDDAGGDPRRRSER